MIEIHIFTALFAGALTFIAPCTLPMVPGYLAYLGGVAKNDLPEHRRRRIIRNAFWFTAGFGIVFVLFGALTGAIGSFLVQYRALISQIGGIIIVLFGLSMLGIFHIPSFQSFAGRRPAFIVPGRARGSFLMGAIFALGWSPCLGPVLGGILVLASTSGSAFSGAHLLLWYAIGLALPFLALAYLFDSAIARVSRLAKYLPILNALGGTIFILIGMLMLFGQFGLLAQWTSSVFDPTNADWFYERV